MARPDIVDYIKSKEMENPKGVPWDGTPNQHTSTTPTAHARREVDADSLAVWMRDSRQFNLRVRRDILVLEKLLTGHLGINPDDLYGDPGDPPQDTEI